jgi:PAS domain S-box-containing protein
MTKGKGGFAVSERELCLATQVGEERVQEPSQADETLSESEYYRLFAEALPEALVIRDGRKIRYANALAIDLLGAGSAEEIVDKPVQYFLRLPRSERSKGQPQNNPSAGRREGFAEQKLFRVDGKVLDVETREAPLTYMGRPATQVVLRDITARKQAEASLRELEAKYSTLVERAKDGMFIMQDGVCKFANAALADICGYSTDELLGMPFLRIIAPEFRAAAAQMYKARLTGSEEAPSVYESRIRCRDGTTREVEISAAVAPYGGRPAVMGMVRDITGRKRVDRALRESERRYRLLAENVTDVIWATDMSLNPVYVSPSVTCLLGYTVEEAASMKLVDALTPASLKVAKADLLGELARGSQEQGNPFWSRALEMEMVRKDGSMVWTEVKASLMRDSDGQPVGLMGIIRDITERKLAEEALRDSEERYRLIVENTDDVIMLSLPDGKICYLSPACNRVLGHSPGDLLGKKLWVVHPDDSQRVSKAYSRATKHGRRLSLEYRIQTGDGETKWVSHSWAPVVKQGKLRLVVSIIRDISERMWAEEALRESERRYRLLAGNITDVIACTDMNMRPTYMSPSIERLSGYSVEESMARTATESLTPASLEAAANALATGMSLADEDKAERFTAHPLELEFYRKDGSTVWVEAKVSFLRDAKGRPTEVLMVLRDVMERKRAFDALSESEQKYSALVEQARDGVIIIQDGLCRFVNQALADMGGYAVDELLDTPFLDRVSPESRDMIAQRYAARLAGEEVDPVYEAKLLRKEGSVFDAEISAGRIHYCGSPADMAIIRDVSERKSSEERLSRVMADLERSNTDLEQFAYVASHDLQEPLRMVASFVQLLGRRYQGQLDTEADEIIGYAVDGAHRMQRLVNDLLTYSRVGTHGKAFETTDCEAVVDQALANLRLAIEEGGAVVVREALPTVNADAWQLVQLFQNLIGNAIKFRGDEAPQIHISAAQREDGWVFSVRDNGIGIAPESFERIFVIFQRLHGRAEYAGTGIGLAVCKKIVERHGGRIWVESEPGAGTAFCFTLPVIEEEKP